MVAVDSTRPAVVESISNRRRHMCSLGPRTEDPGSWKCSWCGHANVRQHAGLDHCSACNAETFTYFTWENEMGVRYSRRLLPSSDRAARFNSNGLKGMQQPSMSSVTLPAAS